jgi:hypothetical protein
MRRRTNAARKEKAIRLETRQSDPADISNLQLEQIAGPKLAVDAEIEQGQFAHSAEDLKPNTDSPDFPKTSLPLFQGLERSLTRNSFIAGSSKLKSPSLTLPGLRVAPNWRIPVVAKSRPHAPLCRLSCRSCLGRAANDSKHSWGVLFLRHNESRRCKRE